jgi:hypothetical protein
MDGQQHPIRSKTPGQSGNLCLTWAAEMSINAQTGELEAIFDHLSRRHTTQPNLDRNANPPKRQTPNTLLINDLLPKQALTK